MSLLFVCLFFSFFLVCFFELFNFWRILNCFESLGFEGNKREAENEVAKAVSAKKQKKDEAVEQAALKKKVEAKTQKKKQETSSSEESEDSSSDSEEEKKV